MRLWLLALCAVHLAFSADTDPSAAPQEEARPLLSLSLIEYCKQIMPKPGFNQTNSADYCNANGNYNKIWLDIVLVVDGSSDMTSLGVENAWSLLNSPLYSMSFGTGPYQSRVGIVSYSREAVTVRDLDEVKNLDDLDRVTLPYFGDEGTNIKSGVQLAAEMLDNEIPGRNAKKVIVVCASAYRDKDTDDPTQIASQFRHDGGIIITIAYIQPGDADIPKLQEIATPGFDYTNQGLTVIDQLEAFVQANCFCASTLVGYSTVPQGTPNGGCLEHVTAPAIYRSASNSCNVKNGTLAIIRSQTKQDFVHQLSGTQSQIWIGLQKVNGAFTWADGYNLDDNSYVHWGPGQPSTDLCVFSQQYQSDTSGWFTANCNLKSYQYQCESKPCSVNNYCYQF